MLTVSEDPKIDFLVILVPLSLVIVYLCISFFKKSAVNTQSNMLHVQ